MKIRLWDFGWLASDRIPLTPAASDAHLIERYFASSAFHTSFLPNTKDETGIHGPFVAARIAVHDFVWLRECDLAAYLESVSLSDTPGDDVVERLKIQAQLQAACADRGGCYVLKRDERDHDLFHDWGWVLLIFREFVCIGPQRDSLERFVIGYD